MPALAPPSGQLAALWSREPPAKTETCRTEIAFKFLGVIQESRGVGAHVTVFPSPLGVSHDRPSSHAATLFRGPLQRHHCIAARPP